jgi:hypothetical protein
MTTVQYVSSGVTSTGVEVRSSTELVVENGGETKRSVIFGREIISRGGFSDADMVKSGGTELIYGSASATRLQTGAGLDVESGGVAYDIETNGGIAIVSGTAWDPVANGTSGIVAVSGVAYDAVASDGGALLVDKGGVIYHASGDGAFDLDGGVFSGLVIDKDGSLDALSGRATSVTASAGVLASILDTARVTDVFLRSGATGDIADRGAATDVVVSGGAVLYVGPYGVADGGDVRKSGKATVINSGTISGLAVDSGGELLLGREAIGDTIALAGGAEVLVSWTSAAAKFENGRLYVESGGHVEQSLTLSGGGEGISATSKSSDGITEFIITTAAKVEQFVQATASFAPVHAAMASYGTSGVDAASWTSGLGVGRR